MTTSDAPTKAQPALARIELCYHDAMPWRLLLVALLGFVLASVPACESGEPSSPGFEEPVRNSGPLPGVLRVRIAGLPPDVRPTITVAGPNEYAVQIDRETDLELPRGDYVIHPSAVGGNGTTPFHVPDPATLETFVSEGVGATVEIKYAPLETKLKADVREVGPEAAGTLTSKTANADGTTTLVFSSKTNESSSWKAGDVLLFKQTATTPMGHFGRVVSTDGTTVVTKLATLEEVYEQGGFHYEQKLDLSQSPTFTPGTAAVGSYAACPTIAAPIRLQSGPVASTLELVGSACLSPTIVFDFWVSLNLARHSYFKVDGTFSMHFSGAALGGVGGTFETSLGRFAFPSFSIGPLVIVPEFDFRVFVSAFAEAGIYTGIDQSYVFNTGFGYDSDKTPQTRSWNWRTDSVKPVWPTPYFGASASIDAGPQVNLLIDGVAGPYLGIRGRLAYDLVVGRDPLWQLRGGLRADTGVATATFINKTFRIPVWDYLLPIATSASTPPIGETTARVRGLTSGGDGLAIGPDDTIYFADGNKVRAAKKNGLAVWEFTADNTVVHVARANDGSIYATDFSQSIYKLNANGGQVWKRPAPLARGLAIDDKYVYTTTFGIGALLEAFAIADGTSWSVPLGNDHRGVTIAKDGTVYAVGGEVYAIDPTTKAPKWAAPTTFTSRVPVAIGDVEPDTSPDAGDPGADNHVFYTVDSTGAVRATKNDGKTTVWIGPPASADAFYGLSVGPGRVVYVCAVELSGNGSLRAYEPELLNGAPTGIGKQKFIVRIPPSLSQCRNAPTVGADGNLYVASAYNLAVFNGSSGALVWQRPIDTTSNAAPPAFLSTREVVVVGKNEITAFYAGTSLASSNWPRAGFDNAFTNSRKPAP